MIAGAGKHRLWIGGGIVLALVLVAASWFFLIGPKLDDAASVRSQTDDAASQNAILQVKVNRLRAESAGLPDLLRSLDTLHTQLPTTSGLDEFTRQLTGQAEKVGVTLTGIVIGVPAVVQAKPGAAPPAVAPDGDSADAAAPNGDSSGTANTAAASSSASDAASATPGPARPAAPQSNLYAIPVTISADGTLASDQHLLDAIQAQGPRGALVSAVQFSPAPDEAQQTGGEPATGERKPVAGETAPGTSVPGAGGPAAALAVRTTMTVQLTVFVAPQSPQDEAALRKQLGG